MNDTHCQMDFECPAGTGVCCFCCGRFSKCDDACKNNPITCGIRASGTLTSYTAFSGAKLAAIRKRRKMSERVLAKLIHVEVSRIPLWESGERLPRQKSQMELCAALDCTLADLRD